MSVQEVLSEKAVTLIQLTSFERMSNPLASLRPQYRVSPRTESSDQGYSTMTDRMQGDESECTTSKLVLFFLSLFFSASCYHTLNVLILIIDMLLHIPRYSVSLAKFFNTMLFETKASPTLSLSLSQKNTLAWPRWYMRLFFIS